MPTHTRDHIPTVLRPTATGELATMLADTAATHPRLLVTGAGTAADWGAPAAPADAAVDTRGLSGVLAYNPADMTISVRAGSPLSAIQNELSRHGQRVALDAARITRGATVGGLVAAGDSGPARQMYGSLRDLVIGTTVVLADGTVARSGGHVIKNVAGYDLAKLFHGSLGTLGVVAEVVLRLHPAPRAAATVHVACRADRAFETATRLLAAGLEPTALEWTSGPDDAGGLLVRIEGTPQGVRARAKAVAGTALDDGASDAAWQAIAGIADGASGDTVLRVGGLPSAGPRLLGRIATLAAEHGLAASVSSSIALGVHTVRLHGHEAQAHDDLLAALHREAGARVTVLRRDGLRPDTPGWGPPPPAVGLMRAIKVRFDPDGRFGTGRLTPWLDDIRCTKGIPS